MCIERRVYVSPNIIMLYRKEKREDELDDQKMRFKQAYKLQLAILRYGMIMFLKLEFHPKTCS